MDYRKKKYSKSYYTSKEGEAYPFEKGFSKNTKGNDRLSKHRLFEYLEKHDIDFDTARKIIHKAVTLSPTNRRSLWKMTRFTHYVWQRHKEHREMGANNNKMRSVAIVVKSERYRRMYNTFPFAAFNESQEITKLYELVTDPRQKIHFKSQNFGIEGNPGPKEKRIPQDVLDKIC